MSMTDHAKGIGTCTQSGMTIPSYLSSQMHLQKEIPAASSLKDLIRAKMDYV